jgi:hypothetical protein
LELAHSAQHRDSKQALHPWCHTHKQAPMTLHGTAKEQKPREG